MNPSPERYRGRIAPSPTGYLHLGHARTFATAWNRARAAGGTVVLRNDDLDRDRVRPEFVRGFLEDLAWLGLDWDEGPDRGGPFRPYSQSERMPRYAAALARLREGGFVYPCTCSRRDIQGAVGAPHAGDDEPLYPGTCRGRRIEDLPLGTRFSWRFRVPDGGTIAFVDGRCGERAYVAGRDFGDFVAWRHDGVPSYQLACVVDDAAMEITEVVRGDRGVYSPATGMARVLGAVRITRGENQVNGREAIVNLRTGVARLVAAPQNRVQGLIVPDQGQKQQERQAR